MDDVWFIPSSGETQTSFTFYHSIQAAKAWIGEEKVQNNQKDDRNLFIWFDWTQMHKIINQDQHIWTILQSVLIYLVGAKTNSKIDWGSFTRTRQSPTI